MRGVVGARGKRALRAMVRQRYTEQKRVTGDPQEPGTGLARSNNRIISEATSASNSTCQCEEENPVAISNGVGVGGRVGAWCGEGRRWVVVG